MKTIVIWDRCEANIEFYVVDGDYSRFDRKYVNSTDVSTEEGEEISNLVYDPAGKKKLQSFKDFPIDQVTPDTKVIVCGFLP